MPDRTVTTVIHGHSPLAERPTLSSESSEVRWVPVAEVDDYTMDRLMRTRIDDFLARNDSPVII